MKKTMAAPLLWAVFVALLFSTNMLQAQPLQTRISTLPAHNITRQNPVFGYISIGGGLPANARVAFDLCFAQGITTSVFGQMTTRNSPNTPSDYQPGFVAIGEGYGRVPEYLTTVGITAGKMTLLSPYARLNIKAGVGYARLNAPEHFVLKPKDILNFGSNYTYERHTHSGWALFVQPSVEFPLTRHFGIAVSPFVNINQFHPVFGVELATQLGYLRE